MIVVTSIDGMVSEPLFNIGDDFVIQQSISSQLEISFTCFPGANSPGYDVITSECLIEVEGFQFKVKQYSQSPFSKTISGISVFYDNTKRRVNTLYEGNNTLSDQLSFALSGTIWSYIVDANVANQTVRIPDLGNNNVVSLINTITSNHNVEYEILTNNVLRVRRRIGNNTDFQYRYKHNLESVIVKESTANLYTTVMAYGAEGIETRVTSPTAVLFGLLELEPIRDERFTDVESLREYALAKLQDVPELIIETKIRELTERDLGDSVWLIYEPLNVQMNTRILKQTKKLLNGKLVTASVTFGSSLQKNTVDLLINQKEAVDGVTSQNQNVDNSVKNIADSLAVVSLGLANEVSRTTTFMQNTNDRLDLQALNLETFREYVNDVFARNGLF